MCLQTMDTLNVYVYFKSERPLSEMAFKAREHHSRQCFKREVGIQEMGFKHETTVPSNISHSRPLLEMVFLARDHCI